MLKGSQSDEVDNDLQNIHLNIENFEGGNFTASEKWLQELFRPLFVLSAGAFKGKENGDTF